MNGIGLKHTFSSLRNAMFQHVLDHAFWKKLFWNIFIKRFFVYYEKIVKFSVRGLKNQIIGKYKNLLWKISAYLKTENYYLIYWILY